MAEALRALEAALRVDDDGQAPDSQAEPPDRADDGATLAQAQQGVRAQQGSVTTLVTNEGKEDASHQHPWGRAFGVIIFTGSDNTGKTYTLTSIRVFDEGAMSNMAAFKAELWSGSDTEFVPVAKITDLTITAAPQGVRATDLVAPAGTTVQGNTRYALVMYRLSGRTATWRPLMTVAA